LSRFARAPGCKELQVDSFEWNKIAGAVLTAFIVVMGVFIISGHIYQPKPLEARAFPEIEGVEQTAQAAGPAKDSGPPLAVLLASASPEKGAAQFKKCAACHTIEKGGANKIGPNLWGIVGSKHAHAQGFAYSTALAGMQDKPWSWEDLDMWIKSPKGYAAGNRMSFAGLSKPEDRAAILVYLNQNSDSPLALPAPPAATAAAPAEAPATAEAAASAEPAKDAPAEAAASK